RGRAFCTIVKNRMQRGGIMAARAGLVKAGKNGRGLHLRWYPETLAKRIEIVRTLRDRISFKQGDGFKVVPEFARDPNVFLSIRRIRLAVKELARAFIRTTTLTTKGFFLSW